MISKIEVEDSLINHSTLVLLSLICMDIKGDHNPRELYYVKYSGVADEVSTRKALQTGNNKDLHEKRINLRENPTAIAETYFDKFNDPVDAIEAYVNEIVLPRVESGGFTIPQIHSLMLPVYSEADETNIKDALQNSNFSVEVVEVSFESSLESAKVSNF